jgi:hypothetical protein
MMMGPEPMIRIFLMSVRLGILALLPGSRIQSGRAPWLRDSFPYLILETPSAAGQAGF